jgi:hypothetical protein
MAVSSLSFLYDLSPNLEQSREVLVPSRRSGLSYLSLPMLLITWPKATLASTRTLDLLQKWLRTAAHAVRSRGQLGTASGSVLEWRQPLIHDSLTIKVAAMARTRCGIQHPVPVRIFYWPAGRFETIEAVNYAAAQELVQKINAEKGRGRHAYIPRSPRVGYSILRGRRFPGQ